MAPVFSETLDAFGAGRAMLGSNWPVDSLFGTYEELIASYEALTAELSLSEQLAVWRENAERLYRF
jgi:predicted TIM-barrel fold metal-dependent hydrolase